MKALVKKLLFMMAIVTVLSGCSLEIEESILTTKFDEVGTSTVLYYKDYLYIDFDTSNNGYYSDYEIVFVDTATNDEVYLLHGNCMKYYYCNESIRYSNFPSSGEFKGIATLENGTTAEFMVTLPIASETLQENEEAK